MEDGGVSGTGFRVLGAQCSAGVLGRGSCVLFLRTPPPAGVGDPGLWFPPGEARPCLLHRPCRDLFLPSVWWLRGLKPAGQPRPPSRRGLSAQTSLSPHCGLLSRCHDLVLVQGRREYVTMQQELRADLLCRPLTPPPVVTPAAAAPLFYFHWRPDAQNPCKSRPPFPGCRHWLPSQPRLYPPDHWSN